MLPEGSLLAILDSGAYGMVLASNYNTRPRPAEVLVSGKSVKVIRRREKVKVLLQAELCRNLLLPFSPLQFTAQNLEEVGSGSE